MKHAQAPHTRLYPQSFTRHTIAQAARPKSRQEDPCPFTAFAPLRRAGPSRAIERDELPMNTVLDLIASASPSCASRLREPRSALQQKSSAPHQQFTPAATTAFNETESSSEEGRDDAVAAQRTPRPPRHGGKRKGSGLIPNSHAISLRS